MVCTYCGGKTQVMNSRHQVKSNQVWRRRKCLQCQAVFTTEEMAGYNLAWLVAKGSFVQPFQRDKLFLSLHKSCSHRKTALSDAQALTNTIISKLPLYLAEGTIAARDIAHLAQVALNRFDRAASAHYQAFHK